MPIGCVSAVPHVISALVASRPESVLDLGIGMGLYGAAVRQWLDGGIVNGATRLVGVEAFSAYGNPCWDLYDAVHVQTIESFLERDAAVWGAVPWGAILCCDVLEHFERGDGERLLERLKARGRMVVVVTPGVWMEQGAAHGNEWERHRSSWSAADLEARGFRILQDGTLDEFGTLCLTGVYWAPGSST
jgi:hypothetical protein